MIDKYFMIWALVLPITSVVVFPSIQGTTPAYLFALATVIYVPIVSKYKGKLFLRDCMLVVLVFVALLLLSQLGLLFSDNIIFGNMRMVNPDDTSIFFRNTMFTQSLYAFACVFTFFFVKHYYNERWDKYIFVGVVLLAIYGIYELVFFSVFSTNGDFLTNRTFQNALEGDSALASVFETIRIGTFTMERLKSLTGEPSMYAFTVLPFWIYAVHTQRTLIQVFLLVTLVLSTSTTAILGIIVYVIIRLYYYGLKDKFIQGLLGVCLVAVLSMANIIYEVLTQQVVAKVMLEDFSGQDRFASFTTSLDFFLNAPILNKIFGIGFGYIRSTDMFTTSLVNVGLVGLVIVTVIFWWPVIKLPNNKRNIGLKGILIVIYITMMISVPEYSYLPIWLYLGIAYNELAKTKIKILPDCSTIPTENSP